MQNRGLRRDQVSQVRGYADQRLHLPKNPLDPSNRRISLIVQYIDAPPSGPSADADKTPVKTASDAADAGAKPSPAAPPKTATAAPPTPSPQNVASRLLARLHPH